MRLFSWLFKLGVFIVLTGFALSNTDPATLRFFDIPEFEWRAPLVLFLLLFFAAGALVGVIATMPMVLRQRRRIGQMRREAGVRGGGDMAPPPSPPAVHADAGPRGL